VDSNVLGKAMRAIYEVAHDIQEEWGSKVYFGAKPYLGAMTHLLNKNSKFGVDTATNIVYRFLANAQTFKGPRARELKAELKSLIK